MILDDGCCLEEETASSSWTGKLESERSRLSEELGAGCDGCLELVITVGGTIPVEAASNELDGATMVNERERMLLMIRENE